MTAPLVKCAICGRGFRSLGHHIVRKHDVSVDDYKDRFGLKRSDKLTSEATREAFVRAISATIESGSLDAHYAGNAGRSKAAAERGVAVKAQLQLEGRKMPTPPSHPRAKIEAIITAIESGVKVATAVKRGGISYTSFHAGLARFPDLKARMRSFK